MSEREDRDKARPHFVPDTVRVSDDGTHVVTKGHVEFIKPAEGNGSDAGSSILVDYLELTEEGFVIHGEIETAEQKEAERQRQRAEALAWRAGLPDRNRRTALWLAGLALFFFVMLFVKRIWLS